MSKFPTNPGLEAAVIGDAENNLPRLVYADWLDEKGDPDRATFIRTQVALWDKNAADDDYVELLERHVETHIRVNLSQRRSPLSIDLLLDPALLPNLAVCYFP